MRLLAARRYVWALPNTALGLILLPVVWGSGGAIAMTGGVLEMYGGLLGPLLGACPPRTGGVSAMTLGHVVIARDRYALEATRAHERVHVRQCERWGPFFLPAYFLASLWAAANGRSAYYGNYFEQQARLMDTL